MTDKRDAADRLDPIEGADAAALGLGGVPEPAPPGAEIEDVERLVPGADFDDSLPTESKPWHTSLASDDDQAGVANDPPDAQPPNYPKEIDPR